MRINQYLAKYTNLSRRKADEAIEQGRVSVNGKTAEAGQQITDRDKLTLDSRIITPDVKTLTIILNKPVGYVVSRRGQGSETVYDLLPKKYQHLQAVGRLDKDSSGLILLTNDGELANQLTHPSREKPKKYEVKLDRDLSPLHYRIINDYGVVLPDGPSKLILKHIDTGKRDWFVTMSEGRNRQIRRTFAAMGYKVIKLHRTHFGPYALGSLSSGQVTEIN